MSDERRRAQPRRDNFDRPRGYSAGRDAGHRASCDIGHGAGRDAGHRASCDIGHGAGRDAGHRASRDVGHGAGRDAGHRAGYRAGPRGSPSERPGHPARPHGQGHGQGPAPDTLPTKLTQKKFLKFHIPRVQASAEELLAELEASAPDGEQEGAPASKPSPAAEPAPAPESAPADPTLAPETPPAAETAPTAADEEFAAIGRALAAAKTKLDNIPTKEFDQFMAAFDLYRGLKRTLRERYQMQNVTNAAVKMYEMITQLGLLACEGGAQRRIRAFFDAELPGAFAIATNHYVRTMCPGTGFDWLASSYYPEAAAATGDHAILGDAYGIYAANRERWLMGPRPNALPEGEPDLSGDLTDADVVAALADAVHARFGEDGEAGSGATLYTSDAGIDVSGDYNRQEELTALLNFGQVLCGILALARGGDLVTKQYTFVTRFSRSLIAVVAALFDETLVVKPLTSRPVNSEVYVVGRGFRGVDPAVADALLDRLAAYRAAGLEPCAGPPLLGAALTAGVDEALLRAARQIHGRQQVAFLEEASELHARFRGRIHALEHALRRAAAEAQDTWLADNPVRQIRDSAQLAAGRGPGRAGPGERRGGDAGGRDDDSDAE